VSNKSKVVLELEAHHPSTQLHASLSARQSSNNRLIDALHALKNKKERVDFNPTTIHMLKVFGNYETGIKRFVLEHPGLFKFLLVGELRKINDLVPFFNNTHNITQIENPGLRSKNTIPSLSRASVDCRIQPHILTGDYIARLIRGIDTNKVIIKESYTALNNQSSPVDHSYYSIIVNTLEALYPSAVIMPAQMPFSTDCQYFRAKGIPVYSFTPIQVPVAIPRSAHASNEHFLLSSLSQGQAAYVQILTALMTAQDAIAQNGKRIRPASKTKTQSFSPESRL
jgi:acetylornithine deacetylase/succinyl-diaminopimelate desuccinylase-like protein